MKRIVKLLFVVMALFLVASCTTTKVDLSVVKFEDKEFAYDGTEKSIEVTNLPEGATVEYSGNGQIEVGTYVVTATVSHKDAESVELKATLKIYAVYDLSTVEWTETEYVYDGSKKTVELVNVPEGLKVVYENNVLLNAGEYAVKATIVDGEETIKEYTTTAKVEKANPVVDYPSVFVVDFSEKDNINYEIKVNNKEQKAIVKVDEITGVGTYQATITVNESKNYNAFSATFEVVVLDLAFKDAEYTYDGEEKTIALEKTLPAGFTVVYENNVQTEVGEYYVVANILNSQNVEICEARAILTIEYAEDPEFAEFLDELLVVLFEGDQFSVNFFFKDPESFGLEHYDASLPVITFDTYEEDMQYINDLLAEIHKFKDYKLSEEQQISYEIIDEYFTNMASYTEPMNYMTNNYLGSYLGYQANLPLELSEYKFRNEQDIQDFITYMETSLEAFQSYYQFCVKQNEYGYGLTDVAIDNVVDQCNKFVAEKDNHYLIDIFNDKISKIEFELSDEKVAEYKQKAETALKENLVAAYQYIAENLPNLKGKATIQGGLIAFGEEGLKCYELMMKETLGIYDFNVNEAIEYIDAKLKAANSQVNNIMLRAGKLTSSQYSSFVNAVQTGRPYYTDLDPAGMIELFKELSKDYVPDLDVMPEISIKYVYESLEENFSPACYFVSPLDETRFESIYLNGKYTDDVNYVFTTLAHEGYPGHLYQNVYAKSLDIPNLRKVLRCQGYMEGWATYMELKSYGWVTNYTSKPLELALEYNQYNDILNGYLSARVDLGIHGQGWKAKDIADYMNRMFGGGYTTEDMVEFYDQVVEIPSNMSMYFYSYAKLSDMHEYAVSELGDYFDEVAFNKVILDCGAAPLGIVEEAVYDYVADMQFKYAIGE